MGIAVFLLAVGAAIAADASTFIEVLPMENLQEGTGTLSLAHESAKDEMEQQTSLRNEKHEEIDWSSLIIPHPTAPKMSWIESWYRCQSMGATPFVPRTRRDFEVIKSVRLTVGYLWLPASDLAQEGALKWWNGEEADGAQGLVWQGGVELSTNSDAYDCAIYGAPVDGLHMWDCNAKWFPMICYKMI